MKRIHKSGATEWYNSSGKLHRINAPAIQYRNGGEKWFVHNKLHQLNGFAIAFIQRSHKHRLLNDNYHNINGPAIEHSNGAKFWFINGIEYSETEYKQVLKLP